MDPLMLADLLVMAEEGAPPIAAAGAWRARELGEVGRRAVRRGLAGVVRLEVGDELAGVEGPAIGVPVVPREVGMAGAPAALTEVSLAPVAPGLETDFCAAGGCA